MISKLDPALWSCQILIFINNYFILIIIINSISVFLCPLPKERMSVISKRSFTYGKCLQGNIGLDTWVLSVISPCLRFAAERGCLSCCLNLLPSWVFTKGFVLEAFFFFFFWNNGCFWESWKVGHCVFSLEKEDPEAGASSPSPLRKDESWHSSPSSGLQMKRVSASVTYVQSSWTRASGC